MNEMNNGLILRKAAYNNGINYQTLHNRINSKHTKSNGRPAKLEEHVESFLVEMLAAMSDIGYSLSQYEVCKYCIEDDDVLDEEFLCNRLD